MLWDEVGVVEGEVVGGGDVEGCEGGEELGAGGWGGLVWLWVVVKGMESYTARLLDYGSGGIRGRDAYVPYPNNSVSLKGLLVADGEFSKRLLIRERAYEIG